MVKSVTLTIDVPRDVYHDILDSLDAERKAELESRQYGNTESPAAEALLEAALRELARQDGHSIDGETAVIPQEDGTYRVLRGAASESFLRRFL